MLPPAGIDGVVEMAPRALDELGADLIVTDHSGMLASWRGLPRRWFGIVGAGYEKCSIALTSNIDAAGLDGLMPTSLAAVQSTPAPRPRPVDRGAPTASGSPGQQPARL